MTKKQDSPNLAVSNLPGQTVTMNTVAKAAGVSMSTVSRVLSGSANVSGEKRQAVEAAIAQLQFVPSPVARGLAGGQTMTVGVVTQAIDSPFYGPVHRGIEDELYGVGYVPIFTSAHWNSTQEYKCVDILRSRKVDGIIVMSGRLPDKSLLDTAPNVPMVAVGKGLEAPELFTLSFDEVAGASLGTQFLIQSGHKKIAFITGDLEHADALDRLSGYQQAIEEAGLRYNPKLVVSGDFLEASGILAVDRLLADREPFSAIQCSNDQMAYGALLSLRRHGLRVPDDVSVIGYDDLLGSQYTSPPLTTVRLPTYDLGRRAARALLSILAGELPSSDLPPISLAIRETTRRLAW